MNQDVQIIEVMNRPDEINETGDTAFRIKLVPQPDSTWTNAFDNAYNSTQTSMWRSAKVSGNMILISCHHSGLIADHMPALKKAVSAANDSCKKIAQAFEANRAKSIAEKAAQEKIKEDILSNINNSIKGG